MNKHSHTLFPIFSLLLAATMWGLIWYPLRLLEGAGLAGLWSTLAMYCAALLVCMVPVYRRREEFSHTPGILLIMGLSAGWCNVAFVLAVLEGSVVRVLLLFYLSPFWTVILGRLFLGERLSALAALVFVTAVGGALFMLWDPAIGWPWPRDRADWLALSSGFAFAIANVSVRHMQAVSNCVKAGMNWLGVLFICLLLLWLEGLPFPSVSPMTWGGAVILGWFGIVIMTLAVQHGVTHMPVYRSSTILLFELVAGAVSASLLTDEHVQLREWIGGGLIVLAAYVAARMQFHPGEEKLNP